MLGNHEMYGLGPDAARTVAQEACNAAGSNVHLLHRAHHDLPGTDIRVVGATLWTYVPEDKHRMMERSLNDFR